MLKVVLQNLGLRLKQQGVKLAGSVIVWFFLGQALYRGLNGILKNGRVQTMEGSRELWNFSSEQINLWQIWACCVLGYVMIYLLTKAFPLRMGKGMFICAAGAKEKRQYMGWQLGLKTGVGMVVLAAMTFLSAGTIFLGGGIARNLVQIGLWLFFLLNINLRVGNGEEERPVVDDKGFMIYAKEEEMNNVYWFYFLLCQTVFFYSVPIYEILRFGELQPMGLRQLMVWLAVLALNAAIAVYCVPGILKKTISYEKIYTGAKT